MKGGNQTMKKIINGLTYNTDTAEHLGGWCNGLSCNDFNYIDEDLYRTKKGRYFLWGYGGAATRYSERCGDMWGDGETIIPMTEEEAKQWAEDHLCTSAYIDAFGEPEEA